MTAGGGGYGPGSRPRRQHCAWRYCAPPAQLTLLADIAFAVFGAPGVAVGIEISQVMSVLAAFGIAVGDGNPDHLAVYIGKHHGVFCASATGRMDGLTAGKEQRCRGGNDAQQSPHDVSPLVVARGRRNVLPFAILLLPIIAQPVFPGFVRCRP